MLIGYYILPKKVRNIWLLGGSLVFYAFGGPKYLFFLLASIVVNYLFGLLIAHFADRTHPADDRGNVTFHPLNQKIILILALVINLASLVYFKYAGMLLETVRDLFNPDLLIPEIIMPLGISFYTFQCISYVVDVYRKEGGQAADGTPASLVEKNPIDFALYIAMFPQLLQGPIIRYPDTKQDIKAPSIDLNDFTVGIERFIIGLAKKALLANTLGEVADNIFAMEPSYMSVPVAWLGAILYTLQIYFDFSGYSDMAVGLGRMFGFHFMENFDYPYISKSVTEFWRRWHISLSRWFRDYLYIPLGGNRKGNVYLNLFIVFLCTGIWHGAAWGFLVWGLWHGIFMLIERFAKQKKKAAGTNVQQTGVRAALTSFLQWFYTMLVVSLGWVLFKIEDIGPALSYIGVMFNIGRSDYSAFSIWYFLNKRLIFFLIISLLACIPWAQVLPRYVASYIAAFTSGQKTGCRVARYICLGALFIISLIFVINNTYTPFIYFQF